jgi:diguanylate cyclase (GGDEF)-like protein
MRSFQMVWRTSTRLATVALSLLLAVAAFGLQTNRLTAFLLGFLIIGSFLISAVSLWIFLRPLVVQLIPPRVRAKLNTLVERVVILDADRRLALANAEFADLVSQSVEALRDDAYQTGELASGRAEAVSALPRLACRTLTAGGPSDWRGTLSADDDLSAIERKNAHLRKLLQQLKQSRAEIQRQNLELKALATKDPLTGCLNRRAFFAEFETHWNSATRYGHPLSCVMVDVDHFKAINDTYGHSTGDQVLQQVAEALKATVRGVDLVCRYGGEEFCVLLPHTDAQDAFEAAERFRQAIAARPLTGIPVTASFGTSSIFLGARELHDLLDQADKALYAAKRAGRNRVVLWDPNLPEDDGRRGLPPEVVPLREERPEVPIPFHGAVRPTARTCRGKIAN